MPKFKTKEGVLFIGILFTILFIADKIISFGVKKSNKSWFGKVNKILSKKDAPNIAIFGSSVGEAGINPLILKQKTSITTYNYSIDGNPFMQYESLIREFNENNDTTKIILLAETYFSLTKKNALTELERYMVHLKNKTVYQSIYKIQPSLVWRCKNIPFYKYIAVTDKYYKTAINGWKNVITKNIFEDSNSGQVKIEKEWGKEEDQLVANWKPFEIEVDSTIIKQYSVVLKKLNEKKRKVYIVLMPVISEISNRIADFAPTRNAFIKLANENGGTFLDYTKTEMCSNKNYFYNHNHLNSIGADNFTNILADTLTSLYK